MEIEMGGVEPAVVCGEEIHHKTITKDDMTRPTSLLPTYLASKLFGQDLMTSFHLSKAGCER